MLQALETGSLDKTVDFRRQLFSLLVQQAVQVALQLFFQGAYDTDTVPKNTPVSSPGPAG